MPHTPPFCRNQDFSKPQLPLSALGRVRRAGKWKSQTFLMRPGSRMDTERMKPFAAHAAFLTMQFKITNKINYSKHVSYGMALKQVCSSE
jgi:hypothetical protein